MLASLMISSFISKHYDFTFKNLWTFFYMMEYTKRNSFLLAAVLMMLKTYCGPNPMFQVILFHTWAHRQVSKHMPTPKPQARAKLHWHTEGSMWYSLSVAPWTCIHLLLIMTHIYEACTHLRISMLHNTQLCGIHLLSAQHVSGSLCLKSNKPPGRSEVLTCCLW